MTSRLLVSLLCLSLAACPLACGGLDFLRDPVLGAQIDALGPEDPRVAQGPLHRPGQPCGACHRADSEAPTFTAAGTIYRGPDDKIPVPDVDVVLMDADGKTFMTTTNCVGNFYVRPSEFSPRPPMWVAVQAKGVPFPFKMESPIHRETSCAVCHADPEGPSAAGHIFVTDDETIFPDVVLRPCGPADGMKR